MTKRKFTEEEVIRALVELKEMSEYTPPICHYQEGVTDPPFCKPFEQFQNSAKIALDLINRQRAEIEDLNEIVFTDRTEAIKMLKAEAIKEFAERLKNSFGYGWVLGSAAKTHIDNLVKEMTEGKPCTDGADCFAAEGKE